MDFDPKQSILSMDFDPKQSILSSQKEVYDYLIRYCGHLSSMIMVEFCPATMDVKVSPPPEGVYFHPRSWRWGYRWLWLNLSEVFWGTIMFLLPSYHRACGGRSWHLKPFAAPTSPPHMGLMSFALSMWWWKLGAMFAEWLTLVDHQLGGQRS